MLGLLPEFERVFVGLQSGFAGDRIRRVMGIVNGTTNFILSRMAESGSSFQDALAEARRNLDHPPRIATQIALEQVGGARDFFATAVVQA